MNKDKLYEAAFRFKKAKPWKKFHDTDLFAIQLSNGQIGYVSIMGMNGEYCALGLYIGDSGFKSYLSSLSFNAPSSEVNGFHFHEALLQQNCLQAALECKDDLFPEAVDEVRSYAKAHKIRLAGKNAYPSFIKFEPGCHPWRIKTEEEIEFLREALETTVLLTEAIGSDSLESFDIYPLSSPTQEIPVFKVDGGKLVTLDPIQIPQVPEDEYEYVDAADELALASVKNLPLSGIWEMELVRMPAAVQNSPDETPYYPLYMIAVEQSDYQLMPIPMVNHIEDHPQQFLAAMARAFTELNKFPSEVRCRDERTYALIKDFFEKSGTDIYIYDGEMAVLDTVEDDMYEEMSRHYNHDEEGYGEESGGDSLEDFVELFLAMPIAELRKMPDDAINKLEILINNDVFPKDIAQKLREKIAQR